MMRSSRDNTVALGIVLGLACASVPFAALAQNFFSGPFNPFGGQRRAPAAPVRQGAPFGAQPQAPTFAAPAWQRTQTRAPTFAAPFWQGTQPQAPTSAAPVQEPGWVRARRHRVVHQATHRDEGQAWCVRGCDGRYFPISGSDDESRAENCRHFCPASRTLLVHGNDIDNAATDSGKPYSELPNAFRYRKELVTGCTCSGKDQIGLAQVAIDNDQTLRKGDIVAAADGLEVARRDADARGGPKFSPLSRSAQALFRHLPVVASGR